MINKEYETVSNEFRFKIYKFSGNILDFLKTLYSNVNIDVNSEKLYISENSDLGMKTFEGNYSFTKFISIYDLINKEDIDEKNCVNLYIRNNKYATLISNKAVNVDLEDYLVKKNRTR